MIKKFDNFKRLNENQGEYIVLSPKGKARLKLLNKEWDRVVERWVSQNRNNWNDTQYGNGLYFFGENSPFTQRLLLLLVEDTIYEMEDLIEDFNEEFNGDHDDPEQEIQDNIDNGFLMIK
jgi:hypothetical protein